MQLLGSKAGYRRAAAGVLAAGLALALAGAVAYAGALGLLGDEVTADVYGSAVTTTQGTDGSASGTVTVTAATTVTDDTDYYSYLTYTPTETGYYSVASTSSTDDVRIRVRAKDTGKLAASGSGYGAQATGLLTAGTTYYLAFAFYDSDNGEFENVSGSIGYTVSKLAATDVTLDTTYTNKVSTAGSYALYSLTVTDEARYRLSTSGVNYTAWMRLYDTSWNQLYSGTATSRTLSAGTYYIVTSLYSSTATGHYTFTAHQCTDLSGATVTTTQESYAFTGGYVYPDVKVTLDGVTVDESDYYISGYSDNASMGTGTVYVCDYYGNELSATFAITAPAATAATAGSSYSVSLSGGEYAFYSFTPTASASYTFCTTGSYDTYGYLYDEAFAVLTSDDDSGTGSNMSITYSCTAGTTYYIGVRFYSSSTAGTFTFTIDDPAHVSTATNVVEGLSYSNALEYAYAATEGTSYEVGFLASYTYAYYSFTPAQTSLYMFTACGNDADTYSSYYFVVYDSSWTRLGRYYGDGDEAATLTLSLEAGATYYVVLESYEAGDTLTFSVRQPASLAGATVSLNKESFAFTGSSVEPNVTVTLADGTLAAASDYTVSYSSNFWPGMARVTVTDLYGTKVKKTFAIAAPSTQLTTDGASATVAGGDTTLYAFTAPADGEYLFSATTAATLEEFSLYVFDPLEKDYSGTWGYGAGDVAAKTWYCYEGDTYYLRIGNNDSASATFTLSVGQAVDVTGATVSPAATSYAFTGGHITPAVTVTLADGTQAAAGSYVVGYADNRYPGIATVTVHGSDDSVASATFDITSPTLSTATAIAPNQLYTCSLQVAGGYDLYSVTPCTAYTYTFAASAKRGARMLLFGADGTLLAGEDSSIEYALEAGVTYYLAVCLHDASATGTYTLATTGPTDLSLGTLTVANATYTGQKVEPAVTVTLDGAALVQGEDYTVAYSKNKAAGTNTAKVTVRGTGVFSGKLTGTFTIAKAANPLTVKAKTVTVTGKVNKKGKLKKKTVLEASSLYKVSKAKGTVSYTLGVVKRNGKKVTGAQLKKIVVNAKTGKITLKKGLKKGTYKVRVKVKAAGANNYKAGTVKATVTIKVKAQ